MLELMMSLYIFDGLIYHHRTVRDLENYPCSFSIANVRTARKCFSHFMHYSSLAEHPKQGSIVNKGGGVGGRRCCSRLQNV